MRIEGHRIWIILLIGIFIIGGYLYYSVQDNRQQLTEQSIRSLILTRNNFLSIWDNYQYQVESVIESDTSDTLCIPRNFPTKHDPQTDEILRALLDMMPPSDFFDATIVADEAGNVLISTPDMLLQQIPPELFPDSLQFGIVRAGMEISSVDYEVFRTSLTLDTRKEVLCSDNNENQAEAVTQDEQSGRSMQEIYLYGAISRDKYNQIGWQISFTALYLLGSMVVLIIASYPILRFVGMGRGDTLLRTHIYQIGLSIILLAIFIGFSISYFSGRSEIRTVQLETISNLEKEAGQLHRNELKSFLDGLEVYVPGGPKYQLAQLPYNEVFKIDTAGEVIYINFQDTTKAIPTEDIPNLKERYYFQRAQKEKYFLGSHFSYLDGVQEGVLSKKVKIPSEETEDDSVEVVRAITFSFDHINRTDSVSLNPQGLKYLIVNELGEVYYQSPSIGTHIPRIQSGISRSEWKEISELMKNNPGLEGELRIPLSFEGQSYLGHLSRLPFDRKDIQHNYWILSLRDKNLEHFRSFSVFMYSAAGYFALLSVILIISLISFLTRSTSYYLNIKQFSFDWLRPSYRKRKNYLILILIILVHTLFFLYIVSRDIHNFWFIVLLFCEAISFIALFGYVLLSNYPDKSNKSPYWVFPVLVFITSIFLFFLAYISALGQEKLQWLAIVLLILQFTGFGILTFMSRRDKFSDKDKTQKTGRFHPETIYVLSVTFWAVMVGLFPGYAIHHFAFHFEDTIWQKAAKVHIHEENDTLMVITQSLPEWTVNRADYPGELEAAGGYPPYRWTKEDGELPDSLELNNDGTISGTPYETGKFTFTVEVTDDRGSTDNKEMSITVRRGYIDSFLDEMEYQRRRWLGNYTGIKYPVIDRYIYTDRQVIRSAFDHHHHLETHEKGFLVYLIKFTVFILVVFVLFLIIRILTRRIFLTQYWDFNYKKGVTEPQGNQTYIITFDNGKALQFLEANYLKDREYRTYDLTSQSVRELLPTLKNTTTDTVNGFILLNIESSLTSNREVNSLINFITDCKGNNKFVVMTGTTSMKEIVDRLPSQNEGGIEHVMINWSETVSCFITIILPIYHTNNYGEPASAEETGTGLRGKLRDDIKYTPHRSTLSGLLKEHEDLKEGESFDKKDYEKFLLVIQRYNKAFYQNIWEKLSFREKQMVFNYANEGFVNHCNIDVLTELLQKGVFRMDYKEEKIDLFNQSFRNYATSAPSSKLGKEFNRDQKEHGNLSHFRNAMLTFVFLAVLGISLIAPDLLDRYIGAISGGLAILSTLASAVGKFSFKLPFFKSSDVNV